MKKILILCVALMALSPLRAKEEPERIAFSNLGISLNGSTTGIGFTLSTPLAKHFALRAGYQFSFISYNYKYDDFDPVQIDDLSVDVPSIGLDSKLNVDAAHIMVDWIPFKQGKGKFFITAGFFVGSNDFITLKGSFDKNDPNIKLIQQAGLFDEINLDIGDDVMRVNSDGSVAAQLKVNAFRPYLGLGWGRAIPKHRFGFRFEMGAVFHGHPKIASDNLVLSPETKSESNDFTSVLSKITVFPQISLQLTYKLFKDK